MDFGDLNTRKPAEEGSAMHLQHPILGHKLYTGPGAAKDGSLADGKKEHLPCLVIVRGTESDTVQRRVKAIQRRAAKNKPALAKSDEDVGYDFLCSLIIRFQNVTLFGKELGDSDEDKRNFLDQSDDFGRQVLEYAQEKANFWKGTSTS